MPVRGHLRNRAFRAYKRFPSPSNLERLLQRKTDFLNLNDELYATYVKSQAELARTDPKKFWRFVNERRRSGGILSLVVFNEQVTRTPQASADIFATNFSTLYNNNPVPTDSAYGLFSERITSCSTTPE